VIPNRFIAAAALSLVFLLGAPGAAAPAAAPPPDLQRARENLKLSEETRDRIAAEVSALEASGEAADDVVAAYRAYLARVEEMVVEHQRLVARMESAVSSHSALSEDAMHGVAAAAAPASPGAAADTADRLKDLDRQFNDSLAAFDEMLLKELRLIQAASAGRLRGMAEAAAEAGRQAATKGRDAASSAETGSEDAGGGAATEGSGRGSGAPGTERDGRSGNSGTPGEAAGSGRPPGGWGPGETGSQAGRYSPDPDDDIVARQLREAAEKETDPELKAKLWKEYEDYKKSRAKP
jgi:hypothetical protein